VTDGRWELISSLADSQLHHPLDEQGQDADLHMSFDAAGYQNVAEIISRLLRAG
jgi:hypothetical protein